MPDDSEVRMSAPAWKDTALRVARVAAWVAGGGALFIAVFTVSFCSAMKLEMRSSEEVVPDLTAATVAEAENLTLPHGLSVEVVDQRHDPQVPSGRVLQQEPPPGTAVRRGRRIKLVLSLGGRVLKVPDLIGQPSRTVTITLQREGFFPGGESHIHTRGRAAGTVVSQVPAAESPSVPGERIHRLVSLGPPELQWAMPDLTGHDRQSVERWLKRNGFRIGPVRHVRQSGRAAGTVLAQRPLAGYPIRRRDVVHLTVAR